MILVVVVVRVRLVIPPAACLVPDLSARFAATSLLWRSRRGSDPYGHRPGACA
jgi:hypothetical protein